jgi:tetratricopeptide (TPR) repeat protein
MKLGDAEGAIERYSALIGPEAGGVGGPGAAQAARRELERLARDKDTQKAAIAVLEPAYEAGEEWGALVDLGELVLDNEMDPSERRRWLVRMAESQERASSPNDKKAAFSYWARALHEEPGDEDARAAMERIADREAIPGELTRVYEEILAAKPDTDVIRAIAMRLGDLYEQKIGDSERAIVAYSQALESASGDTDTERAALRALDRLLSSAGRPRDLAEVLEKQAAAESGVERVGFLHRLGVLRVGELVDLDGALNAFRDALEIDPDHAGSIAGLTTLLGSEPHREAALDLLEPVAERSGDAGKQNQLAELRLGTLDDDAEKLSLLERIAERAENALRDLPGALAAMKRALALAPAEERLAEEVERLATMAGRPSEAAVTFEELIDLSGLARRQATPTEVKRALALRAGRIWEGCGDTERAEKRYLALLASDREDKDALEALERLYRVRGDASRLAEILTRRAAVELDAEQQRALYGEAARLAEESLGDRDGAIELWQKVLGIEESDAQALSALGRLYESRGRWADLADLLSGAARLQDDVHAQASLLSRIASIAAERLNDLPRAIAALRELLDLEPTAMAAIDSLIELEQKRGDDLALREALERKLAALPAGPARIPVFRRLADLAARREDLGAVDDALGYLYEILALDANDAAAGEMQRTLLEKNERWNDLVDVITAEAGRRGGAGDTAGELQLLVRAADLWEEKLESPESASEILERILARDPNNVRALLSLARIAEASGDTERAREMLSGAEKAAKTPGDVAELAFRRGKVEAEAGDDAAATAHYRRALDADKTHAGAIKALLEQARNAGNHAEVASLLEAQLGNGKASDGATRLEVARLYIERLSAPDKARPHLEAALSAGGNEAAARELLADLHFVAGRYDEAHPLFEALLKDAVAAKKRGKELAKLHLRIGELAEKKGDLAAALAAFGEAQRIDGGHSPTLVAIGRLQRQKGDWEAARKAYRSLLLQNLDADAGISKAGVYLALGEIHEKLNEGPKAVGMYERGLETASSASGPDAARELEALKSALARLRG